jgi:hypothetical protein
MQNRHTFGLLITCLLMTGCTVSPGALPTPTPAFTAAAEGEGNELKVSVEGEAVAIDVHSRSGIGAATVELVSGAPPENIVVRLSLQGLEEFRLSSEGIVVTASVSSGDAGRVAQSLGLPEGGEQTLAPDSPLWLDIRIVSDQTPPRLPLEQGYFEVALPKDFLREGRRTFAIRWIDFYR